MSVGHRRAPWASSRGRAVTVEALRRISAKRKNVRGVVNLCEADDLLQEGTHSPGESRLRRRIVEADFPEPEVNPVLHLRGGRLQRPGLAWRARRLCLEFDGDQHCTDVAPCRRIAPAAAPYGTGWRVPASWSANTGRRDLRYGP